MMRNSRSEARKQFVFTIVVLLISVTLAGCGTSRPDEHATATLAPTATVAVSEPTLAPTEPVAPTATSELSVSIPENLSAGDPYTPELGNAGYDVQHYTLELALDPSVVFVDGHATIEATSTMDNLDQVSLDFIGFDISDVSWAGTALPFFQQEDKLIVDLPEPLSTDTPFTLHIAYSGEPVIETSAYVPFISHLGLYQSNDNLFVVSEPDGARYWFPSNDHPSSAR